VVASLVIERSLVGIACIILVSRRTNLTDPIIMSDQLTPNAGTKEFDPSSSLWADTDYESPRDLGWCKEVEEFQEGFLWSCCRQTGEKEGCIAREHLVRGGKAARVSER
jgi:hypothetical protein